MPLLISSMREGTDRICFLSTSLRTFSRSDADHKVAFNIHDGIESTLLILKYRLKGKEGRPTVEIIKEYGDLPLVMCFAGQLNQVFMNIIANAIDAFDLGNLDFEKLIPTIRIRTEVMDNNVVIRISDNGPGMSDAVKEKIFEYLYTTKPVGTGTGLGLHISKQIVVEKHEGKLSCESEVGAGATFIIELPL
jgi:signal transduction histidine kinase